jgi:GH25 family lysozyme M1 (1,4-beta-N-acetylmuramidase)
VSGIDVSHWQEKIAWSKVHGAGYRFAFAKATEGTDIVDAWFSYNWSEMKKAGMIRGAYGWIVPGGGAAQADYYLSHVKFEKGDLPPAVDVEEGGVHASMVGDWVDRVKEKTGRTPIVYTAGWTWNGKSHTDRFIENPLWVADYVDPCPVLPHPWKTWSFWQFPGDSVPGIDHHRVDHDRFDGSLADLEAFAGSPGSTPDDSGVGASARTVATVLNLDDLPEVFAVKPDG